MNVCPRCGASFECGMAAGADPGAPCWCTQVPPLPADDYQPAGDDPQASRCFCPYCLKALLAASDAHTRGRS